MWTTGEYIAGAGECGTKPCGSGTKKNSPAQTSTSQIRFHLHVNRDDWQEEWGETDKTMVEEFQNEI